MFMEGAGLSADQASPQRIGSGSDGQGSLAEYITSQAGFLHDAIPGPEYLPAGCFWMRDSVAILFFFIGTSLYLPAWFPGRYNRQCQRFLPPAFIQAMQERKHQGCHRDRDAKAEKDTSQKSKYDVHHAPRLI
jgi:hypothetical protein